MHRDVFLLRRGRDGEGVPLVVRKVGDVDEDVLTGLELEVRHLHAQLHHARGMLDGLIVGVRSLRCNANANVQWIKDAP